MKYSKFFKVLFSEGQEARNPVPHCSGIDSFDQHSESPQNK